MISLIAVRLWQWFAEDYEWPAWAVLIASQALVLVILIYNGDPLGIEAFLSRWWWFGTIVAIVDYWLYARVLRRSRFGPKNRVRYLRIRPTIAPPRGCGENHASR